MWEKITKEQIKEFILSLDLVSDKYSDEEKLKILYTIANHSEKFYTPKYIKKKDGTKRELLVPKPILKSIQHNILTNVLNGLSISKYAKAYVPKCSIKENAEPHKNKKLILKLDIKNFFTNITFEEIYKSLPNYIFPPQVKVLLIKLCTYYDYLPQGAPTSPMLSNLALKVFDNHIGNYCEKRNISYTRYSDDLTFSGDFNPKVIKNKVQSFLEEIGFNLNEKKTKVIKRNYNQTVTGITVNNILNPSKEMRKKIRQEMYYIKKCGIQNHCKYLHVEEEAYIRSLIGRMNYCVHINPENKEIENDLKTLKNMLET